MNDKKNCKVSKVAFLFSKIQNIYFYNNVLFYSSNKSIKKKLFSIIIVINLLVYLLNQYVYADDTTLAGAKLKMLKFLQSFSDKQNLF